MILVGIMLRFADLGFPDFATDEAQAALGATAAWTPLGMMILEFVQGLFGREIFIVRGVSVFFGLLQIPLMYSLALFVMQKRRSSPQIAHETALIVTAITAIFPSHILYSRLAWLSVYLCTTWTLVLYAYLRAREKNQTLWLVLLFLASVFATLLKTQGLLFPLILLFGRIIELLIAKSLGKIKKWEKVFKDELALTLVFSFIPVTFYILTHPGIAATVLLYGGDLYGLSNITLRFEDLFYTWWHILTIFLIALIGSLRFLWDLAPLPKRWKVWPIWGLLFLCATLGLLLGPGNGYYTTYLVLFSLPIGIGLMRSKNWVRMGALTVLFITTILSLGPRDFTLNTWTLEPFKTPGYWNLNVDKINALLKDESAVTVLGYAGHHLRWYLDPYLYVGRNMTPPYPTKMIIILGNPELARGLGGVVFADDQVTIVLQE